MSEYAKILENEATEGPSRYQQALNELYELEAERDDWLDEIEMLDLKQTYKMSTNTLDVLKDLKQQMVEAVNGEYEPKIYDCKIRISHYERIGA